MSASESEPHSAGPSHNLTQIINKDGKGVQSNFFGNNNTQSTYLGPVTQFYGTQQDRQRAKDELISRFCPPGSLPYRDRMKLVPDRHTGTCGWFQCHENYNIWRESRDVNLLVVSADPGCGKSVLVKSLINKALKEKFPEAAILYFFFENQHQSSILDALCAILHQLFDQYPHTLNEELERKIIRAGSSLTKSFDKLTEIFKEASDHLQQDIICVLDALDECKNTDLPNLTYWLKSNVPTNESWHVRGKRLIGRMKFLATTRGLPEILESFEDFESSFLRISAEEREQADQIQNDIKIVMKARCDKLVNLNAEQKMAVWDSLIATGSGQRTYLWVKLIFKELEKNRTLITEVLRDLVKNTPRDIFETYDLLLKRVKDKDHHRVQRLLHLMFSALRPLRLREINVAIQIMVQPDTPSEKDLDLMTDEQFRSWIIDTCGFFLTEYDGRLFFIHSTAREYLQSHTENNEQQNPKSFRRSITEKAAHVMMAKSCLVYLSMHESGDSKSTGILSIKTDAIEYTFLDYAATSWAAHFQQARDVSIINLASRTCDPRSQSFQTWFQLYLEANNCSISPHLTHLVIASYLGLDMVVQELLGREAAVDEQDIRGWTALHWATILAADTGHLRMGSEFLMNWTSSETYPAIVQLLLNKGARADKQDMRGWTPLHWAMVLAAENGHLRMENEFLMNWNSSESYHTIVRPLVGNGAAGANKQDMRGWTPLHWAMVLAAENGHLRMENEFLMNWNSSEAYHTIVRPLVGNGAAGADKQDMRGWTPLHWAMVLAAENGHLRMENEFLMNWNSSEAYHTIVRSLVDKRPEQMVGLKKQLMVVIAKTKKVATRWWLSQ